MISGYDDPVLNNIQASVFMIDEGTVADLPLRHIRPLEERFSYLPAQAIHCMLAGVAPLDYGEADLQYGKEKTFPVLRELRHNKTIDCITVFLGALSTLKSLHIHVNCQWNLYRVTQKNFTS